MSDEPKKAKPGIGKWFLKKFFTSVPTWIGLSAGVATGVAFLETGPVGGAIGFGSVVAFTVGALSWLVISGVHGLYANAHKSDEDGADTGEEQGEVAADLRAAGHENDADVLDKMFADRDAILKRCAHRDPKKDVDAAHTVELVQAIVSSTCLEAEELHDLLRRMEDPLLDDPENAEEMIAAIRERMRGAYQAVADSRRRLRRGEKLQEVDFLEEPAAASANVDLQELTGRLEEETAISRRVEERLMGERPDRADWMEDDSETNDESGETDTFTTTSERLRESE